MGIAVRRYFPAFDGSTWVVAYQSHALGIVVELDGMSEDGAIYEARRLNWTHEAAQAMPQRNTSHYGMRRSVRQFVNEDIHG